MKNFSMMMALFMAITGFVFVDTATAGRVGKRQVKQQKRIHQGVKSGEITKKEFKHLEREQARLQKNKKRALSDGELTKKEKFRLERKQNKASRHIYRAKHNDHDRN